MSFNIDIAIFLVFLILNLIVGLSYSKEVKTVRDYALGGRNFSTGALVSTIVATCATGSMFFVALSKTYSNGLYYLIALSGFALSFLLLAIAFIPRMNEFIGKTSIAEAMGELFGKEVQVITAISGAIGAIGSIAVQYKAFGNILNYFVGFSGNAAIIIAGSIVTIYSAFGGIRAVTSTDILQFITFGIGLPLIGILIWNQLYTIEGFELSKAFQTAKFNYVEVLNYNNPGFWPMVVLLIYFAIPGLEPVLFQRIVIGRNTAQVKKAFIISAALLFLIILSIAWIPFLVFNIDPTLEGNQILSYIVDNYTYPGLKGLIIIGVVAMAMSSADSFINIASVLFTNDFCKPLNIGKNKEMLLTKLFAISLGAGAIILALIETDLLTIVLTANSFYMPIVTVPFMAAIFGFRTTKKPVLIAMGAGFATVIIWDILKIEVDCIIFAMLINFIFLMGSHYLLKQNGGWTKLESSNYTNALRKVKRRKFVSSLTRLDAFNIIEFCKKTAPKNELMYMGLGIYCIFYTFTTMYSTQIELLKGNGDTILTIYQIMMITGVMLAMYPIWPPRIKKEVILQISWNIVIFYMLIFFSSFFVMISNFGQLQFAVFTINIVITAILTGWQLAFCMIPAGFYLSTQFYKYYADIETLNVSAGSPQFIFMYFLTLAGAAFIIFLKPKQEFQKLIEEKNGYLNEVIRNHENELGKILALKKEFINNMIHAAQIPINGLTNMAQTFIEKYDSLSENERRDAAKNIYKSSSKLDNLEENLRSLSKLENSRYDLKFEELNLSEILYDRIDVCRKLYSIEGDTQEFILDIEDKVICYADKYYITQTFDNLIINAITYGKDGKIKISLKNLIGAVEFSITDEDIISREEILDIFEAFTLSSKTHIPAGGRGIGLALCKRVIDFHRGKIEAKSDLDGTTFRFTF